MQRNKAGLADLKKLREQTHPPEPAAPASKPVRAARKRAPFLPPSAPGSVSKAGAAPSPANNARKDAPTPSTDISDSQADALSPADRRLFRHAVRYVEKMKDPGRVLLSPTAVAQEAILKERRLRAAGLHGAQAEKRLTPTEAGTPDPAPTRKPRQLSDTYAPLAQNQDDSRYLKPGHGTDVLRDLKRGKWPIGASLDLHGSTLDDARERFDRFLGSCLAHDVKCVLIVHGKGYGSPNGDAVLKTTVRRWLTQIAEVIAYIECAESDGGSGAVQVLLVTPGA